MWLCDISAALSGQETLIRVIEIARTIANVKFCWRGSNCEAHDALSVAASEFDVSMLKTDKRWRI